MLQHLSGKRSDKQPHRIPTPDAVPGEYVVNVYAPSGPTAPEQLVLIFPGVPSVYTVPVAGN